MTPDCGFNSSSIVEPILKTLNISTDLLSDSKKGEFLKKVQGIVNNAMGSLKLLGTCSDFSLALVAGAVEKDVRALHMEYLPFQKASDGEVKKLDKLGYKISKAALKEAPKFVFRSLDGTVCSYSDYLKATGAAADPSGFTSFVLHKTGYGNISCADEFITHRCKADIKDVEANLNNKEVCEEMPEPSFLEALINSQSNQQRKTRFKNFNLK